VAEINRQKCDPMENEFPISPRFCARAYASIGIPLKYSLTNGIRFATKYVKSCSWQLSSWSPLLRADPVGTTNCSSNSLSECFEK
jgi:hypothetical protein